MIDNGIEQPTSTNLPTKKILLWIAMVSMIMLFGGLTSAYLVRQAEGNWLNFDLPKVFAISTGVLLLSSVSMNFARSSAKKGNTQSLRNALLVTLILGLTFVVLQFSGWKYLIAQNVFFAGKTANSAGSFLYVLTGLHLAHLAGGILYLMYSILVAIKNSQTFTPKNILTIELCAIFWHFLDGLWIYLFLFLNFAK